MIPPIFDFDSPEDFLKTLTQMEQIIWLYNNTSPKLVAGDGIKLTQNDDGSITISKSEE